jgi:hypothetical protein
MPRPGPAPPPPPEPAQRRRYSDRLASPPPLGHGESDKLVEPLLPCAATVDRYLPCLLCPFGCPCVRSHPDLVLVPFDLVTERTFSRRLAVVTFVCFSWQAFLAYFVALVGTDPVDFALCGETLDSENPTLNQLFVAFAWAQSGNFGLFTAAAIGLGNSRWHPRCWGGVSVL